MKFDFAPQGEDFQGPRSAVLLVRIVERLRTIINGGLHWGEHIGAVYESEFTHGVAKTVPWPGKLLGAVPNRADGGQAIAGYGVSVDTFGSLVLTAYFISGAGSANVRWLIEVA